MVDNCPKNSTLELSYFVGRGQAEGEAVKGLGQIEFYVRGQLVWIFKIRPNSDFNAADCYGGVAGETPCAEDWQKLFYPCKDIVDKQKQKQKVVSKKRKPR